MTKPFQMTKSISPGSASMNKAEQGLLEQPGFPEAGGKAHPCAHSSWGSKPAARLPWILIPGFSFFFPNKAPFQQLSSSPGALIPSHMGWVHFRTIPFGGKAEWWDWNLFFLNPHQCLNCLVASLVLGMLAQLQFGNLWEIIL